MKRIIPILSVIAVFFLLVSGSANVLAADVEPEEVDLAVVDSFAVTEEDPDIMFRDIREITDEMGYELTVDTIALKWYLEGETETVTNFAFEDVTEEFEEVVAEKDEVEDLDDLLTEKEEVETGETTVVLDITDKVITKIAD